MPQSSSAETLHRSGGDNVNAHQRQDLTYRYAASADLLEFYGARQRQTTRAVVLLLDEVPAAVIGIAMERDCAKIFSDAKPQMGPHMKRFQVLRAIQVVMAMVKQCGRDVYAVRDEGTDILIRLGFEHVEGEVYRWRH